MASRNRFFLSPRVISEYLGLHPLLFKIIFKRNFSGLKKINQLLIDEMRI